MCSQSPLGVFKNCGAQTNSASHMRFAADYSETLEVFFVMPTDGMSGHLYVSQSVVCELATVLNCDRYGDVVVFCNKTNPVYLCLESTLYFNMY
jgi:hypothetical protein